jgi:hypothetical protein
MSSGRAGRFLITDGGFHGGYKSVIDLEAMRLHRVLGGDVKILLFGMGDLQ